LLALYSATHDERWFIAARRREVILERFADPAGVLRTADDHEALIAREGPQDNALRQKRHGDGAPDRRAD
jgi:hypothetical protein